MSSEKEPLIREFVRAIGSGDWSSVRFVLLGVYVSLGGILLTNQNIVRELFGHYQVHFWVTFGSSFVTLFATQIIQSRTRASSTSNPLGFTRTIRALSSFREDDVESFAKLGRGREISDVVNALLDSQFRFCVLFSESGCGKTSLLRAGVQPTLKTLGYTVLIEEVDDQEEPSSLMARLLRAGEGPTEPQVIQIAEDGGLHLDRLLSRYDGVQKPVFVILDQFEQFFVHYGRSEAAEPFLSFLERWYTRHKHSQLRILLTIREDYLAKVVGLQQRIKYLHTEQNFIRLEKFSPTKALQILRAIAVENDLVFDETAVGRICQEELSSGEDGRILPVTLQLLAASVRDLPGSPGFTADALRSLGGLEGVLERYLQTQLATRGDNSDIALAVLGILSEFEVGAAVGWRSAAEITSRLVRNTVLTRLRARLSG